MQEGRDGVAKSGKLAEGASGDFEEKLREG